MVKVVANATMGAAAVRISPMAIGLTAILLQRGALPEELDGIVRILEDPNEFDPNDPPTSFYEIAIQPDRAIALYRERQLQVVDATEVDG